jgi:hypothetical protein
LITDRDCLCTLILVSSLSFLSLLHSRTHS